MTIDDRRLRRIRWRCRRGMLEMRSTRSETLAGYLFAAPSVLFFTVFVGIPIFMTIFVLSFSNFSLLKPIVFNGFTNFRTLFIDPDFKTIVFNTLKFIVIIAPLHIILGLVLAVAVDAVRSKPMQGVFRTVLYFPLIITTASIVLVWSYLYDTNFGVFNWALRQLNIAPIPWLDDVKWSLLSVAIFSAWKFIGNAFLYYFIGLQNVPETYMEAASIDGATRLQAFFRIKLPLLTPTLFFVITTTLINCFQMFDEPYFLTKGGPGVSSQTIAMHIYRKGFGEYHFGYASCLGLILFIIVLLVTFVQFGLQGKWVTYDNE
jgi:multiple sugar transport system permease protein